MLYHIAVEPVKVGWDGVSTWYDEITLFLDPSYSDKCDFSFGVDEMGIPRPTKEVSKEEFIRVANNAARYNPALKDNMSKYSEWID